MAHVLVTGAAGFIGYHVARRLLGDGVRVTGVDNLNPYYTPALKRARLAELTPHRGFDFVQADLASRDAAEAVFSTTYDGVVHLAAQAGVRYSVDHPHAYTASNIEGFLNVLEGCRHTAAPHLVFASSSSVYGDNARVPFSEHDGVDHPVSLYAATKRANELMAHTYAHLYGLPVTGLRFFTVYGPWGRPDMAVYLFTERILRGEPITLYADGELVRDFTYVDDIVEGVVRVLRQPPTPDAAWDAGRADAASSWAPYRLFNIGGSQPVRVRAVVDAIERATGRAAEIVVKPRHPGDVVATHADASDLEALTGFRPSTPLAEGIEAFVAWYRAYHRIEV